MSEEERKRSERLKRWVTVFTFVALGTLIYVSRHQIVDTFHNLKEVTAWILIFMVVWQLLNYHAYTQMYRSILKMLGKSVEYRDMYKTAVELNFVNHILPSAGVSGFSYFSLRLKSLGVPASKATLVQMMRFVLVFVSMQLVLMFGLFALAVGGKASNLTIMVASVFGTIVVIGSFFLAWIVGSKQRIDSFFTGLTKGLNRLIHLVRPKHPETISVRKARSLFLDLHKDYLVLKDNFRDLKRPLLFALLANLTEIATLYTVYLAFGEAVNIGAVILAYAVANIAGLVSVLPGGVGVYEALMTAVLISSGIPAAVSIPVTVMYRILSMSIQLPPGYFLYQKFLKSSFARNEKPNAAHQ